MNLEHFSFVSFIAWPRLEVIMSSPSWSSVEIIKLAKVLSEAKETGLLDAALAALNSDPSLDSCNRWDEVSSVASWEEVNPGAMTDASKRRSLAMTGPTTDPTRTLGYGATSDSFFD